MREGFVISFVSKSININGAGYIYPRQEKIRSDSDFTSSIDVGFVIKKISIDDINDHMSYNTKVIVTHFINLYVYLIRNKTTLILL